MSIYKMTNKQMIKFVILYRDHECLWKTDSPFYKNRDARDLAYKRISDEMNIEGFRPSHVAQKIKNLRTTYHQELRKIALSQKYGTSPAHIYKPRAVWFEIVNAFLREQIQTKLATSNSKVRASQQSCDDIRSEVLGSTSENDHNQGSDWESHVFKMTKTEPDTVSVTFKSLDDETEATEIPESSFSECDFFGSYVDNVLKNLPFENSLRAQRKIMQVLSQDGSNHINDGNDCEEEKGEYIPVDDSGIGHPLELSSHHRSQSKDTNNLPYILNELKADTTSKRDEYAVYGEHVGNKLRSCGRSHIEIAIAQYHVDKILFYLTLGKYSPNAMPQTESPTENNGIQSSSGGKTICRSPTTSLSYSYS